jgi:hypothetical protein
MASASVKLPPFCVAIKFVISRLPRIRAIANLHSPLSRSSLYRLSFT